MAVDQYLREVGHETERLAKAALSSILFRRYVADPGLASEEQINLMLVAITNAELGARSTAQTARAFCSEKPETVRRYAASNPLPEQRTALYTFLYRTYVEGAGLGGDGSAAALATAVTNMVFGDRSPDGSQRSFEVANAELIEILARRIGEEEALCNVLSGAAYNSSYARYLDAGGKRGFINPYLGYVRAVSRGIWESAASMGHKIGALGESVLAPIHSMSHLGIFRSLPNNPNEKAFYQATRDLYERVKREGPCPPLGAGGQRVPEGQEEHQSGGSMDPDIVCNGYAGGKGAEVWGFNDKAVSWLKANVQSGRWVLGGKALQVPMEEVSRIVTDASAAGLEVKTNNI